MLIFALAAAHRSGSDGVLKVFDLTEGRWQHKCVAILKGHAQRVRSVACFPDVRVVSASDGASLSLSNAQSVDRVVLFVLLSFSVTPIPVSLFSLQSHTQTHTHTHAHAHAHTHTHTRTHTLIHAHAHAHLLVTLTGLSGN
jgi:WD40 repeat protein